MSILSFWKYKSPINYDFISYTYPTNIKTPTKIHRMTEIVMVSTLKVTLI